MYKNPFWLFFLILVIASTLFYGIYAFYLLYQYDRLDVQVPVKKIEWQVKQESEEKFVPFAQYQYEYKARTFDGTTLWNESYLNPFTAQETIKKVNEQSIFAWIDASSPEYSSLQKDFPIKQLFYMLCLIALSVYLLNLGQYVKNYYS